MGAKELIELESDAAEASRDMPEPDGVTGRRVKGGTVLSVRLNEEEFAALGVPFERRGARADDYLAAMRKGWSGEVVEHESEFLSWHGFKSYPVPMQSPLPLG